jgi:ribosomal protein L44E
MIYCVVPPELGDETFQRLVEHYKDNPNVEVIWERRRSERRQRGTDSGGGGVRTVRDRRQHRSSSTDV